MSDPVVKLHATYDPKSDTLHIDGDIEQAIDLFNTRAAQLESYRTEELHLDSIAHEAKLYRLHRAEMIADPSGTPEQHARLLHAVNRAIDALLEHLGEIV